MKTLSRIILSLCLLGCSTSHLPAAAEPKWDLRYEAKLEPDQEGAVERLDGTRLSFQKPAKKNYDLSARKEGLDFTFHGAGVFSLKPEREKITLKNNTLEFRLRLERTDNRIDPPASNASAVCIQIGETQGDDPGMYMVGFYTDAGDGKNYVILEGRNKSLPFEIGSEFHTYRVVARDDSIALHVDGEIVGTVAPRRGVNQPGIRLGNARGSDHTGAATLSYLRMNCGEAIDPEVGRP